MLVDESLVPPETIDGVSDKEMADWKSEYDVTVTLKELGHKVETIGLSNDLTPLRDAIVEWKPDIAFVMLEEFHGVAAYDQAVVSYLELMRQPYTGCNPTGLLLTRDKALAKKILAYHRIPTPRFELYPVGRTVKPSKRLRYPLFVKSASEDASFGISQASIVKDEAGLLERVGFMHSKIGSAAIAEEFIDGRELYVGVIGNHRLVTFPIWEMVFDKMPNGVARIATQKVKWDEDYQKKYGIATRAARDIPPETEAKIIALCKRTYRTLNLSGFARMDLRLRDDGRIFLLEANANPNLEYGEDFAESAHTAGISYQELLQRIINLGLRYQAPWRTFEPAA